MVNTSYIQLWHGETDHSGICTPHFRSSRSKIQTTCNIFLSTSNCEKLSGGNAVMLFSTIYLLAVGVGGVNAALPSHGADQFEEKDKKEATQMSTFFNWLLLSMVVGGSVSLTCFVWVQDNKGFDYGFGLSMISMFVGAIILICGLSWFMLQPLKRVSLNFPRTLLSYMKSQWTKKLVFMRNIYLIEMFICKKLILDKVLVRSHNHMSFNIFLT